MAEYKFEAIGADGKSERGTVTASDEAEAYDLLVARALLPASLKEIRPSEVPWYLREISLSKEVALRVQIELADLLALLFSSKLQLPEILQLLSTNSHSRAIKRFATQTKRHVLAGGQLSTAFSSLGTNFSPLFHTVLTAAETTGDEGTAISELAGVFRKRLKLSQSIASALIYPLILVAASLFVLAIMIFFLAPALEPIFSSSEKELPMVLSLFLTVNNAVASNPTLTVFLAVLTSGCTVFAASLPRVRALVLDELPLVGQLTRQSLVIHSIDTLTLLLRNGVQLSEALRVVGRIASLSRGTGLDFEGASLSIERGGTMWEALCPNGGDESILIPLVRMGEENNQLPEALSRASKTLSNRLSQSTERALTLLTPVLTAVIGLVIGSLVYVMFDAILSINDVTL